MTIEVSASESGSGGEEELPSPQLSGMSGSAGGRDSDGAAQGGGQLNVASQTNAQLPSSGVSLGDDGSETEPAVVNALPQRVAGPSNGQSGDVGSAHTGEVSHQERLGQAQQRAVAAGESEHSQDRFVLGGLPGPRGGLMFAALPDVASGASGEESEASGQSSVRIGIVLAPRGMVQRQSMADLVDFDLDDRALMAQLGLAEPDPVAQVHPPGGWLPSGAVAQAAISAAQRGDNVEPAPVAVAEPPSGWLPSGAVLHAAVNAQRRQAQVGEHKSVEPSLVSAVAQPPNAAPRHGAPQGNQWEVGSDADRFEREWYSDAVRDRIAGRGNDDEKEVVSSAVVTSESRVSGVGAGRAQPARPGAPEGRNNALVDAGNGSSGPTGVALQSHFSAGGALAQPRQLDASQVDDGANRGRSPDVGRAELPQSGGAQERAPVARIASDNGTPVN